MSISTLVIFLAGFLGGLYVLKLIFEDPTKKDQKKNTGNTGTISMDDEESYSFGSEEEPRNRSRNKSSS